MEGKLTEWLDRKFPAGQITADSLTLGTEHSLAKGFSLP